MSANRLDTVLRIRALQERVARGDVERARGVMLEREAAVRVAEEAVNSRAARVPDSPAAFAAQRDMLAVGTRGITLAEHVLGQAQVGVADSIGQWTEASRRLDGVERLDARFAEQRRLDELIKSQVEIDDLVVTRWKREAS